ncbi:hypothetical protein ACFFJB_13575 [Camelimonas abortus]|uniref:Uncharacterized protein n=1 Tax=Camelimonas abortus TaxID=1017184 RepID=A0ABV7LBE7_9HYPH
MNISDFTRRAGLAAFTALFIGGGALSLAAPASAAPGHGHRHHHHHGHFHRHGWGYGAAGVIGGLALGALAASAYAAPVCYDVREPVVDRWGRLIRYRVVRVCD